MTNWTPLYEWCWRMVWLAIQLIDIERLGLPRCLQEWRRLWDFMPIVPLW